MVVANPNCTTAIAAVVLWPIHQRYQIKKIIISTYQAASGAGSEGMTELLDGTVDHLAQKPVKNHTFPHPLPFNVIPQIDVFQVSLSEKKCVALCEKTARLFCLLISILGKWLHKRRNESGLGNTENIQRNG
jgi:aspartate-semialdehyde dehydrogenase